MSSGSRSRPRLGRGLSALLDDAAHDRAPATNGGSQTIPTALIEPGPFQPRAAPEAELAELVASIRQHGVLQPILVRPKPADPGRFQIIGGERRWRAAQLVPLHEIPVLIRDLADQHALAAALVENLQRSDLTVLEEAEGFRRLMREFGLTQDALGEAVGKSRSHIANTLRLLALPEPVRALLVAGTISAGHARALLTAPDPGQLARQVVAKSLNVRQTEALAAATPRPERPRETARDGDIVALERDLAVQLGLRVRLRGRGRGGELSIAYDDFDQLEGLLRLLRG